MLEQQQSIHFGSMTDDALQGCVSFAELQNYLQDTCMVSK